MVWGGRQNVQGFAATLPQHSKNFGTVQLEQTDGLGGYNQGL